MALFGSGHLGMADSVEIVVVGAGVVGLAIAKYLAESGHEVLVLEKEKWIGSETSARNSEVIHAGLYYPPESKKAALCIEGKEALYTYCDERGIPHRRCGKLIVAADDGEITSLQRIRANGIASGVDDLVMIDADAATALEPNLKCVAALHSPSTGIVDSHQYMLALEGDIAASGGMIALQTTFLGARRSAQGFSVTTQSVDGAETLLSCRWLVNAAGLHAQAVARLVEDMPSAAIPARYLAKGLYFTLSGAAPFQRLVYPLPTAASLGLHYSVDLGGQARFGPDVEWIDTIDYEVDGSRARMFEANIRRYFPALKPNSLQPGYAGIRPKIVPPGAPAGDFVIQGPIDHGLDGLIHLFGIESPGLTSSLAIGRTVATLVH